jgi:precorrin-8X/cobalt-precorrin-8 methylmutase
LIKEDIVGLNVIEQDIVERIVHSTADPEYAKIVSISSDFVEKSLEALKNNNDILTDINMVKSGITQYEGNVDCFIKNQEVIDIAKDEKITRAAAAIQYAAEKDFHGIIAIGNAPTALYKAIELYDSGKLDLVSIVGVPVGFVGAADSKEVLRESSIPNIITKGPKGGTPVAVACVNSLIQTMKKE